MNIIITGASKGIGYELVKAFANDSANNILAISRNEELLSKLKRECLDSNQNSNVFP
ncbi:MAG: SDR family NAD(P)-dependent oxidoreductase, partial [Bacteroidales bacterium]|nr:SDR family NAD(P)-dependent oxidoreductase [Bacteroidales bacterium]